MNLRQPVRLTAVLIGAAILGACGSSPSPTTTPAPTLTVAPTSTPSSSGTPASFGSLTITGQVMDTLVVQSEVPCNQMQGLSLEGGGGTIVFQLFVTDSTPGTIDISAAGTQVTVQLAGSTSAGNRVNWAGGNGTGTGSITAPASVTGSGPGTFTIDAVLLALGGASGVTEHATGTWTCG